MGKFFNLLKLKRLDKPGTYNLYNFQTYDSQVHDFFDSFKSISETKIAQVILGFASLIFWGIIALIVGLFYYVLVVILGIVFYLFSRKKVGYQSNERFNQYLKHYYHKPALFYLKLLEGNFFSKVELKSPSLEIGVEDGEVSLLHFNGKKIDIGSEYVPDNLGDAQNKNIFKDLICFDVRKSCFVDNTFSTILMVHIVDHFPEFEKCFKEVRRILKPGGICIFSTLDKNFLNSNPLITLLRKLKMDKAVQKYKNTLKQRRAIFNDFTEEEFENKLKNLHFEILEHRSFLKGEVKYLWGFFFFYFETVGGTEVLKVFKKLKKVPRVIERILCWSLKNIYYSAYLKDEQIEEEGEHVFFIIKKPGLINEKENFITQDINLANIISCPRCHGKLLDNQKETIQCLDCGKLYFYYSNKIPVLLDKD